MSEPDQHTSSAPSSQAADGLATEDSPEVSLTAPSSSRYAFDVTPQATISTTPTVDSAPLAQATTLDNPKTQTGLAKDDDDEEDEEFEEDEAEDAEDSEGSDEEEDSDKEVCIPRAGSPNEAYTAKYFSLQIWLH